MIRLDDLELRNDVQQAVFERWDQVATDNLDELSDMEGFRRDFNALFGFDVEGVDYDRPTETDRPLAP